MAPCSFPILRDIKFFFLDPYRSAANQSYLPRNIFPPSPFFQYQEMRRSVIFLLVAVLFTSSASAVRTHCLMYNILNCDPAKCTLAGGICKHAPAQLGVRRNCLQYLETARGNTRWSTKGPRACFGCGCIAVKEDGSGLSNQVGVNRKTRQRYLMKAENTATVGRASSEVADSYSAQRG